MKEKENKDMKASEEKQEEVKDEKELEQKTPKNVKSKGKKENKDNKPEENEAPKNMQEDKKEGKTSKPHNKGKKILVISIISIIVIFAVLLVSTIFALINMNNIKIFNGISVLGMDVSGLTVDEARDKINDAINSRFQDENNNLILKRDEIETNVSANTFNAKFDVDSALTEAYNTGRTGNIFTNNYGILFTKLFKKEIEPSLYLDEDLLDTVITDFSTKMQDAVKEYSYYIEDENLVIVKGKAGYTIDKEKLKNQIREQLKNIYTNYQVLEIPTIYKEPDPIDIEKIHSEIYKEPQDAYVETNPTTVHMHVDGVDFNITIEEAKKLIEEDKEEYTIPLKITHPKKTINDLGEEAFPDLLATFSTIYDPSNSNRSANIELASKKVNGTVVMPGEIFSYNKVVGKRTIEAGFKEGTAYIGGKVVPDVGGGICQLSSTLYNTALLSNLEITERSNHMFLTGYVAESRDATVYYGSVDFAFKNTRQYPIKIVVNSKGGVCKVSIYGIKEKVEYDVYIQSKVTSYISYSTVYQDDPTLEEGKEVVEQAGVNGCRSEAYKILKLNGKVVKQTLLSKDTYSAKQKIVRRGTKKVTHVETPEPTPTPSTSTPTEVQPTQNEQTTPAPSTSPNPESNQTT